MPTVVYVACAGPAEIHRFAFDQDRGELAPLDVVAVPGRDGPSWPGTATTSSALSSPRSSSSAKRWISVGPAQVT